MSDSTNGGERQIGAFDMDGGDGDEYLAGAFGGEAAAERERLPLGSNRLPVLAEEIRGYVHAFSIHRAKCVEHAIEGGRRLHEAKRIIRASLGHGAWLPWLVKTANIRDRTARDWMRLARAVDNGRMEMGDVADLGVRGALERLREESAKPARPGGGRHSSNDEWYTPAFIVETARAVLGCIDLDPASCEYANRVVQAGRYFDQGGSAPDELLGIFRVLPPGLVSPAFP